MKIGRVTWIILGVVVLGVAFALLYMQYSKQLDEQSQLKANIAANQATVAKLSADRENWQSQLNKLNDQLAQKRAAVAPAQIALDGAKSVWPKDVQSIEYDQEIFNVAGGWNLDVSVVQAQDAKPTTVQGIGFMTTSFALSVTGQPLTSGFADASSYRDYVYQVVGNILGFVDSLANDKIFSTASIGSVSISVPPVPASEQVVASGLNLAQPVANLSVTVYTYTGG